MPEPTIDGRTTSVALAHDSLLDARAATLLVEGVGRVGPRACAAITLCERAGRPVLLCPASSVLVGAVGDGCAAVLTVAARTSATTAAVSVAFLGRLQPAGTCGEGRERTAIIELAPSSIVVEHARAAHEHVDLPSYTAYCRRPARCARDAAADTELVRAAERIRLHTNEQHATRLIEAAARLAGLPPGAVAGAALSAIDRCGLLLDWADQAGGHRLALSFTSPAPDVASLARSVREALDGRG